MSVFTAAFLSEEGFDKCFSDSSEDIRFSGEEATFIKSLGTCFTDFSTKVLKLIKKQESSRLKTYPTGTFNELVDTMINSMKKTATVMNDFGSSLDDVTLVLNNTSKSRQTERQKLYGESNMYLSTIKNSKLELEKKNKEYNTKAKSVNDAMNTLAKLKASAKPKSSHISKAESKEDRALNALSVATECYEYQIQLTNDCIFEAYNTNLPEQLKKFEAFKLSGIKHYGMVCKQICELFKKIPKSLVKISEEFQDSANNFDETETLSAYIQKNSVISGLPKPITFQLYSATNELFPSYEPKPVKEFTFSVDYSSAMEVVPAKRAVTVQATKKKKIGKKRGWRPGSSRKSGGTLSGVPVEEETVPTKKKTSSSLTVPSFSPEDDGVPIEEEKSDDGIPIEEDDGIPIEEDDGIPVEENRSFVIATPTQNTPGISLNKPEQSGSPGIPLNKPQESGGFNLSKAPQNTGAPGKSTPKSGGFNLSKTSEEPTRQNIVNSKSNTISVPKEAKQSPSAQGIFDAQPKTNSLGATDLFIAQQMMMQQNPQYRETMAQQFAQNPALYQQYQLQMAQYQQAMQQQYLAQQQYLQQQAALNGGVLPPGVTGPTLNTTPSLNDSTLRAGDTKKNRPGKKRHTKDKLQTQLTSEQLHDGTIRTPSQNDINSVVNQLGMTTLSMSEEEREKLRAEFGNIDLSDL